MSWKKNYFLLSNGKTGRKFIDAVSRLMNEWLQDLPIKDIALKEIMVMPNLLLQNLRKIRIKGSARCTGKKDGASGGRGTSGVSKSS